MLVPALDDDYSSPRGTECSAECVIPVHPRVGGERIPVSRDSRQEAGSSPRGRGTRTPLPLRKEELRFIPAWAGNADTAPAASRA